MSRRWASLQQKDGSNIKLPRKLAFKLLAAGELVMVRRRPLTVRETSFGNYHEEQRHLSGRIVPGATRRALDGRTTRGRGCRVVIPRSALDPEAQETNRWLHRERLEIVAKREQVVKEIDPRPPARRVKKSGGKGQR
jgi:hypothetical protein